MHAKQHVKQLINDQMPGTRIWTDPANQAKHPAFVLVPQSPLGWDSQPRAKRTRCQCAMTRIGVLLWDSP